MKKDLESAVEVAEKAVKEGFAVKSNQKIYEFRNPKGKDTQPAWETSAIAVANEAVKVGLAAQDKNGTYVWIYNPKLAKKLEKMGTVIKK